MTARQTPTACALQRAVVSLPPGASKTSSRVSYTVRRCLVTDVVMAFLPCCVARRGAGCGQGMCPEGRVPHVAGRITSTGFDLQDLIRC